MKPNELKSERIRQGKTVEHMAEIIGKSRDSYAKKENGKVVFRPHEMAAVCRELKLDPKRFDAIFFDSQLLFSKFCDNYVSEL